MTPVRALDVAAYLVELAAGVDENDLTNLKLQKLLYLGQKQHIAQSGSALFEDEIEAWQYGPVVPAVYHAYKACGPFPITLFDVPAAHGALDDDAKAFIRGIWESYGIYSASYLVSLTHRPGSPWHRQFYSDSGSRVISPEMLRDC